MLRRDFLKATGLAASVPWLPAFSMAAASDGLPRFSEMTTRLQAAPSLNPEDYTARRFKLQALLAERKLAGLFLEPGVNSLYFTGYQTGRSERLIAMFIPAQGEMVMISPAFEESRLRNEAGFEKIFTWEEHQSPYALFARILGDLGLRTASIAIEPTTRYFVVDAISREVPQAQFVNGESLCEALRMRKTEKELALMRLSLDITEACIRQTWTQIRQGMKEQEVAKLLSQNYSALGLSGGGLIQFGPSAAVPHGGPGGKPLEADQIVLMDCGTRVKGYTSDITRTTVFGNVSRRHEEIWQWVHRSQSAGIAAAKPGVACERVDAAARKIIDDAGYGKYFTHRLGHGIGLEGHEAPYFARGNQTILQPGMTLTVEPGIYIPGEFGVRLEDDIVITENGCELLTQRMSGIEPISS
jgi:Xaa-Pro dipeptidase